MSDNNQLLSNALQSLLNRLDEIDRQCAAGFPLYSVGNSNDWLVSKGGSWMGGFWAGCWWLRARQAQVDADYKKAVLLCEKLSDKTQLDSSYRSLIFWYGAALGDALFSNVTARRIANEAANALAASYHTTLRCLPLGSALGGGETGQDTITVDGLASLIDLLIYSGNSEMEDIARQHTDTLIAACLTKTGAFHSEAHCVNGHFQATDSAGDWSRGQAWAMLGLTRAAQHWGEPYLSDAKSVCEYWRQTRPEPLPPDRLSQPSGLCDPSASVIASLAILNLSDLISDKDHWRAYACHQIMAIIHSDYFSGLQHSQDESAAGIFGGCCVKTNRNTYELVETAWGSFLLMIVLTSLQMLSLQAAVNAE